MSAKVLAVCGPTASGKTSFAVEAARRLGSEVICADCMTVYRGLDIGSAKPAADEMCGVPHHMLDVADPSCNYSVSDYEEQARPICERLLAEGRVPVVCGGTGFYIRALLFSRSLGEVGADQSLRAKLQTFAAEHGNEALHARLALVDAESARVLHPNDVRRVIRALEIFALTGKKKSEQNDEERPRYPYLAVAFDYPRAELYDRIDRRVDQMLESGLVEEVRALLACGVPENAQCMQGIGYKEVVEYLKNRISHSTMREIIQKNSRNYAKRQITFFKKLPDLIWLDPHADAEQTLEYVLCQITKN